MPRPYVGQPFSLRLPPVHRALLEAGATARAAVDRPPSQCTPAAVLRDLIALTVNDHTDPEELLTRLT
jgi:hypothetical protein